MAESVISSFLEKLSVLIVEQISLFGVVEGQVKQLRCELQWIRQFLEYADAERRYDKMFKLWVSQIRDAAFDAEDAIDEFAFQVEHQRSQRLSNLKFLDFLPTCIYLPDKVRLVNELNARISEINITLEKILINKRRYGMDDLLTSHKSGPLNIITGTSEHRRDTNQIVATNERTEKRVPIVEENNIVGMVEDMEAVKKKLLDGNIERAVVAIVGMGGLGKTTLAKRIYQDCEVQQHFLSRAWVYVSQEFSIRELLLGIAQCIDTNITQKQKDKSSIDDLGEKVSGCLGRKRYLIVLDDVWSTDVWQQLSNHFPNASNGSKVLITTRKEDIVTNTHADGHRLKPLPDPESWELFLNKVGSEAVLTRRQKKQFKKVILQKCKGLPLAIVVLGGLISLRYASSESWQKELNTMAWHLSEGPDSCLGILARSYNELPSYLKPCFLYCGIFPQDSEIRASQLIRLWVFEGFIQKRGKASLEDVAEEYLNELVQRSLIQVTDTGADGRVKSCRIHDLLRDLAISEAKEEKLFEVDENVDTSMVTASVRRLISDIHRPTPFQVQYPNLRSLIFNRCSSDERSGIFLDKYPKLLQVLHFEWMKNELIYVKLSRNIGELIHLKYLCFTGHFMEIELPPSIGELVNLHTLEARDNSILIPRTVWKLQKMRHLNCLFGRIDESRESIRERWRNRHLGVHRMTNLQTLSLTEDDWARVESLGKLTQLKQLKLRWCSPGVLQSIAQLTGLQKLNLLDGHMTELWPTTNAGVGCLSHYGFLRKLCLGGPIPELPSVYPPHLMQLKLQNTWLMADPMPALGRLSNLRILKLFKHSYLGREMNCPQGGFLQLEFLQIQKLRRLEALSVAGGVMPNLKTLKIEGCPNINKFPDGILQLQLKPLQRVDLYNESEELQEISESKGEECNTIRRVTSHSHPNSFW